MHGSSTLRNFRRIMRHALRESWRLKLRPVLGREPYSSCIMGYAKVCDCHLKKASRSFYKYKNYYQKTFIFDRTIFLVASYQIFENNEILFNRISFAEEIVSLCLS